MKALQGILEGVREIFRKENIELDESSREKENRVPFLQWRMEPDALPKPALCVAPRRRSRLTSFILPIQAFSMRWNVVLGGHLFFLPMFRKVEEACAAGRLTGDEGTGVS